MEHRITQALAMCYQSEHAVEGMDRVLAYAASQGWKEQEEYSPLMFSLAKERIGEAPSDRNEHFCRTLLDQVSVLSTEQARALIELARKAGNRGAARQVVGRLQRDRADSVVISLLNGESRDFIAFVVSCFSFSLETYLAEFSAGETPEAVYLVPELLECFPDESEEQLLEIYEQAAEGTVKQVLAQRLGCTPGRNIAYPPVNKFFLSLPNPHQAQDAVLHRTKAAIEYSVAPYHLRCMLLGRYLPAKDMALVQSEDAFLTSRLGPVNTLYDAHFSIAEPKLRGRAPRASVEFDKECDKCAAYGGCREFICTCFECDPLEEEDVDAPATWFTGTCGRCEEEIPEQYSARRIPLEGGGWKGCFCSVECLQLSEPQARLLDLIDANTVALLQES